MALIKNPIPILEYDDNPQAVLMPDRAHLYQFPEYAVFPFLGDEVERYAKRHHCPKIGEFETITKIFPIYQVSYGGKELCLCQAPLGGAAAAQFLDFLIGYGVRKIISAGSCGALVPIEENQFLIPTEALRDEGASYHYLPASRTVQADPAAVAAIKKAMKKNGFPWQECRTWTTDGFFRETKDLVAYRREEGFSVVEMECASLFACAQFRNVTFGQFLFTADTLADVQDDRDWGEKSYAPALQICLDAAVQL